MIASVVHQRFHMSYINSSNRNLPNNPYEGAGSTLLLLGSLALLVYLISSGAAVFAASLTAGIAVILVIAVSAALSIPVYRKHGWKSLSFVLLLSSGVWGALGGVIVFKNHWLAFTPTAWVLNGLYIAALVSGAWLALNSWLKVLAALLAVSLVTATALLPRPPGGEGLLDTAKEWSIDVSVVDENHQPLDEASVLCGAVMSWEKALKLPATIARQTDREGRIPTWEFNEDPRLKVVICSVWKNANDGNAGYPSVTQFVLSPLGGGKYELHFTLDENPHPEVAFLTLDLSGDYEQSWYTLQFELWPSEPVGYFGSRDGPRPRQTKSWSQIRGNGFTIPVGVAAQDLYLRYFYEGPNDDGFGPPHSEVRTISVGSIDLGTSRRLQLTIPNRSNEQ